MDNQVNQARRICPKCGAAVAPNSAFCTSCGSPLPKEPVAQPQQRQFAFCIHCGSKYPVGDAFCQNCGKKTKQVAPNVNAGPVGPAPLTKEEQDKRSYDQAVSMLSVGQYDQALQIFASLGDYADARAKAQECVNAKENARKEQIYMGAVSVLTAPRYTDVDLQRAIGALQSIPDYKDSRIKITEIEARLAQFMAERELARKEFVYVNAMVALTSPTVTDVQINEAIGAFRSLGDYKDSAQRVMDASARLDQWYKDKAAADEAERIRKIQAKKRRKSILITAIIAFVIVCIAVAGIVVMNVPHLIEYDLDGGYLTEENPSSYIMLEKVTLNNPVKTGYDFIGWTENGAGAPDLNYKFNQWSFEDKKLTAHWAPHAYRVTLDLAGGQLSGEGQSTELHIDYMSSFELPEPTKEGFVFGGWYSNGKKINNGTWTEINDLDLVAEWIPVYGVSFEANGGTVSVPSMDVVYGQEFTLPTPTRTGYNFDGWYNGSEIVVDGVWYYETNITLTAKWTAKNYRITFYTNGGTLGSSYLTVTYDKAYTLPTPTRTGYTFAGWYDTNGKKVESGTWTETSDISLNARWTANTYSVTLNANGGTVSSSNLSVTYDASYSLPVPTRTGYTFAGWYNGNTSISNNGTWRYASNLTLTARWNAKTYTVTLNDVSKKSYVTVTFNYNYSGSTNRTQTVNNGYTLSYPTTPTRSGYIFTGWYTDAACRTRFNFTETITEDMTLYAGWTAMLTSGTNYSYTPNPANYYSSSYAYTASTSYTSSSYQNKIYLVANESGTHYIHYKNYNSSSSYRYYLTITNLTQNKTILSTTTIGSTSYNSVSFSCNAGDVILISFYRYNSNYSTTAYFYFRGFNAITSSAKANINDLVYNNGYTSSITATYGSSYNLPTPTREGYRFLGWFNGNTKVESGTWNTDSNVTLTPRWEQITYYNVNLENTALGSGTVKVTYNYNYSGYTNQTVELSSGQTLSYPSTTPTRSGYVFAGWYTDSACTVPYTFSGTLTQDITLYAKWISYSSSAYGTMSTGSSTYVYMTGTTKYYAFVPLVSGTITVYSTGSYDTVGYLCDSNFNTLVYNDDYSGGSNFQYTYNVTAGTLYYIGVRRYSSSTSYSYVYVTGTARPTTSAVAQPTSSALVYSYGNTYTTRLGYGVEYTLPTLTRSGYTFDGWYYGDTKVPTSGTWNYSSNITLTPRWR